MDILLLSSTRLQLRNMAATELLHQAKPLSMDTAARHRLLSTGTMHHRRGKGMELLLQDPRPLSNTTDRRQDCRKEAVR